MSIWSARNSKQTACWSFVSRRGAGFGVPGLSHGSLETAAPDFLVFNQGSCWPNQGLPGSYRCRIFIDRTQRASFVKRSKRCIRIFVAGPASGSLGNTPPIFRLISPPFGRGTIGEFMEVLATVHCLLEVDDQLLAKR